EDERRAVAAVDSAPRIEPLRHLGSVAPDDAVQHHRESEGLAAGAGGGALDRAPAFTRLVDRWERGVVLVGEPDGRADGAGFCRAADDDRRPRALDWLRLHLVRVLPFAVDLGELPVELVEAPARCPEREA